MKTQCLAVIAALFLSACAMPPLVFDKSDGTQEGFDQDKRECNYDVLKNTQTADPAMQSIIGQELDRSMRQRSLYIACMDSRGYTVKQ
jgi:hypothetical protein